MNEQLDIHQASPAEREEIYRQSYEIWGRKDLLVDDHINWRMSHSQHNYGTWYVGCIGGQVATSLAAYANTYGFNGQQISGIAIASVFTSPEFRGQGFAPQMLKYVEDQARESGGAISLLFSDVGTNYYAKMGYIPCESWQGIRNLRAKDAASNSTFQLLEFDALAETERLTVLYQQATCNDPFHVVRTPEYWQAFLKKDRNDRFFWLTDDGTSAEGYVRLRVEEDHILIRDLVWPSDWGVEKQAAALNAVFDWGKNNKTKTISCWAPRSTAFENGFNLQRREVEITMIKPLSEHTIIDETIQNSAACLREIDHV